MEYLAAPEPTNTGVDELDYSNHNLNLQCNSIGELSWTLKSQPSVRKTCKVRQGSDAFEHRAL